jgi:proteasome lid subunit RPN8/RPN11
MLEIDRGFFDEMVEHGLAEFPNEACGLLAGKEGRPVKFFPMTNRDASSSTYQLDPEEHLRVDAEIDEQHWELLAIFHTHTHSEAYPSPTDQEKAFWLGGRELAFPGVCYLILSLTDRANPELRGFRIEKDRAVDEVPLVIA